MSHHLRRALLSALLGIVFLLGGCAGGLRAKFPTEEEVRSKLRRGMTADEVFTALGKPGGHHFVNAEGGGKLHYIAPHGTRTAPREGYAGFTVYLHEGKVWDWEIFLLNPSYEHRLMVLENFRWELRAVGLAVVGLVIYGLVRGMRTSLRERSDLLEAYATSEMPTGELPSDFRFINHETSLEEVTTAAGPYSRMTRIVLNRKTAARLGIPLNELGATSIAAFSYELPNGAAVIVMPEYPSKPHDKIRAVWCRPARQGEAL